MLGPQAPARGKASDGVGVLFGTLVWDVAYNSIPEYTTLITGLLSPYH